MTECSTQIELPFHPVKPVQVVFDAPESSSDGGLLLLRRIDDALALSEWLAACLNDDRDPTRTLHDRKEQVRQRIYQIACGYEDCNDADSLRHDRLLKTVCDLAPTDPRGLSSQPTLSRFENAVSARALVEAMHRFEDAYVASLPDDTEVVILDIDSTADETHGQQELNFYHGFYDHHMYHPLLVFDGMGRLVAFLLRAGNTHAARRAKPMLERIIRKVKARFPGAQIVVRADSGFCVPRILDSLEQLDEKLGDIDYLLGLARNAVLQRQAQLAMSLAAEMHAFHHRTVRHFTSFTYAAATWSRDRYVACKAEHGRMGDNPRFVVTSLAEFPPRLLYDAYCERGECENHIKELKNALNADRLSCSRFVANAFRLCLHAAAYRLMWELRERAGEEKPELLRRQFDTLRLKLLKVAAIVTESARRILVRLPAVYPWRQVYVGLLSPAPG